MKICQRMYEAAADDMTKAVEEEQEENEEEEKEEGEGESEGEGQEKRNDVAEDQQPKVLLLCVCLFT